MGYMIDPFKGEKNSTVSAQWASRPADQRFLDLASLEMQVGIWRKESRMEVIEPKLISPIYQGNDVADLRFDLAGTEMIPTAWGFEQIARIAGCPATYLSTLPAPLTAMNLRYRLQVVEQKPVGAYMRHDGATGENTIRALTSPRYGRIYDQEVVQAVRKVAGNGTGDTRWKVPGQIDWNGQHGISYNPQVDITKQNTTLYASDRDVFIFLVDDLNPIEVGKLPNGEPDLMFRGFYVWNSEVGARTFGIATMFLRGVCQNRNLWGVEGFNEVTFKHGANAPTRFEDAIPLLHSFAEGATTKVIEGVKAAKDVKVEKGQDEQVEWLGRLGFSQKEAKSILDTILAEEQHTAESVWDMAQGITAFARGIEHADERVAVERIAGRLLDKVTA
jgi:hypothetical protein